MAPARPLAWYRRLWVRIYLALVVFTLILAAIGLLAWEVLNDFPGMRMLRFADAPNLPPPPALTLSKERMPPPGLIPGPPELPPRPPRDAMPPPGDGFRSPIVRAAGPLLPIPLVMFLITAVAMLLVAYPVARWLARSIERIAGPVNAFGAGNLAARAPLDGPGEVGELAREFNEAANRIQALVRSQQSLLANASHELRSPLARIQMQLEQIGTRSSVEIRADIRREIADLDALVEEILLSSRLQSQHRPELVDDVELLALTAEEAARVGGSAHGSLVHVRGDARLLRRVLRNILENAVRYSGDAGNVEAVVALEGDQAHVDILDRGPGVPAGERERIFEPFYRARGAAEMQGGVGLGLSLARQIVNEHGGTLECLERDGGGGHFRLILPLQSRRSG